MIAADSNNVKGLPPGPSESTIAGIRWFGVIFRNSGLNWSPAPILTGITLYSRPSSSSAMCTLWPLGVGQVQTSSISGVSGFAAGTRAGPDLRNFRPQAEALRRGLRMRRRNPDEHAPTDPAQPRRGNRLLPR